MSDKENVPQVPSLNPAFNRLKHEIQKYSILHFSSDITTTDRYLLGPGIYMGDGFPIPFSGKIHALSVYDQGAVRSNTSSSPVSFNANDRISLFANFISSDFTVEVHINGASVSFYVARVPINTTLAATVILEFDIPFT